MLHYVWKTVMTDNKIYSSYQGFIEQYPKEMDIEGLSLIFNSKAGIINGVMERFELEEYGLSMFQCVSAKTSVLFDLKREVSSGGLGVNFVDGNAFKACIGEAIERYCMSYTKESNIYLKSCSVLPSEAISYTNDQYDKSNGEFTNPFKEEIYCTKIKGVDGNDRSIWYPSCLIYLPFENQKPICETTSTGVAAHINYNEAIFSGLLEVIERDAVMINFFQKLPKISISINSILSNAGNQLCDFLKKIEKHYSVLVFKQYSDINIPIFLCYIWDKNANKDTLHFGIGACASLDSDEGITKALKECLFTYFYSKNMMHLKKDKKEEINALYEHFLYYQKSEKFFELTKVDDDKAYSKESFKEEHLFQSIRENNLNCFYEDLTTKDISDNTSYVVVKSIIPEMIDLNKSYKMRRLGLKRLLEVPKKLGLPVQKTLNTEPHPFP